MTIRKVLLVAGLALCVGAGPVLAQGAHTTRIEPRAFYGATVSIEGGVRVFRPLPPTRHVIINPDAATPLNLGYVEKRVYQRSYNESRHYHDHDYSYRRRGIVTHSNVGTGGY